MEPGGRASDAEVSGSADAAPESDAGGEGQYDHLSDGLAAAVLGDDGDVASESEQSDDAVSGMQYGISSELTSMTYHTGGATNVTETRQYSLPGQLTQITAMQGANTVTNLQYVFPAGTNNGRISSMVNIQSGETVTYTYDALNRLTNAVGSGWSEAYAFDGFGNLTQKGAQTIGALAASNRLTGPGVSYGSNGNQTGMQVGTTNVTNSFDIENRLLEVSGLLAITRKRTKMDSGRGFAEAQGNVAAVLPRHGHSEVSRTTRA